MSYLSYLVVQLEILGMIALALNLVVSCGQLHAGIAAFYGIGALTLALLLKHSHLSFPLILGAAGLSAALASLAVSIPSWKFRGEAFVIVSLAAQVCIYSLMYNLTRLTGGPFGIAGIRKPALGGLVLETSGQIAVLYGTLLVIRSEEHK